MLFRPCRTKKFFTISRIPHKEVICCFERRGTATSILVLVCASVDGVLNTRILVGPRVISTSILVKVRGDCKCSYHRLSRVYSWRIYLIFMRRHVPILHKFIRITSYLINVITELILLGKIIEIERLILSRVYSWFKNGMTEETLIFVPVVRNIVTSH